MPTRVCTYVCVHECLNTGARGSLASGRELTNSKETKARPQIPKSEDIGSGADPTSQWAGRLQRDLPVSIRASAWAQPKLPTCFQEVLDNPPPLGPAQDHRGPPSPHSSLWPPHRLPSSHSHSPPLGCNRISAGLWGFRPRADRGVLARPGGERTVRRKKRGGMGSESGGVGEGGRREGTHW